MASSGSSGDDNVPLSTWMQESKVSGPESDSKPVPKVRVSEPTSTSISSLPKRFNTNARRNIPVASSEDTEFEYEGVYKNDNRFKNKEGMIRFDKLSVKEIYPERVMNFDGFKEIEDLANKKLNVVKLLKTILHPTVYFESLVREFYANLSEDVFDLNSEKYRRVCVRQETIGLCLAVISSFLGTRVAATEEEHTPEMDMVTSVLTEKKAVWDGKCKNLFLRNL